MTEISTRRHRDERLSRFSHRRRGAIFIFIIITTTTITLSALIGSLQYSTCHTFPSNTSLKSFYQYYYHYFTVSMSAAAARRRKQLAARSAADVDGHGAVLKKLQATLLQDGDDMDETTAYEALQLAQSIVRKRVKQGDYHEACVLCSDTSLVLLQKQRVAVASQLLQLLVEVLRETHTLDTNEWMERVQALQEAHTAAMSKLAPGAVETLRLARLQRDWLRDMTHWSSDLGTIHYGQDKLHQLFAEQSYALIQMSSSNNNNMDTEETVELWCDAVQHMALAEQPDQIVQWLATLPEPTDKQTSLGHSEPPALRDSLLTRTVLLLLALQNLRDANTLVRGFINTVETTRTMSDLCKSYTSKDDGKAPSHVVFCCMLLKICEKDTAVGPLYTWLLKSFKKELEKMPKPQVVMGYTSKIGSKFFNIQPPPNMLSMVENMMGMMGGGGGGGGLGGMNPAMMQAFAAQMQGGMQF
jgi:hypothetical protein